MSRSLDEIKNSSNSMVIGIVVGEASGDLLGAGLIRALKKRLPEGVRFIGIGGPRMAAEGFENLFPMDRLAVMGITEVLKRLPELLRIRKRVAAYFANYKPTLFIGIDAPDFNLDLESSLRRYGIKTVHYVSPSVWAWRQERVHKIKRSVDMLLALFPFEAEFYHEHDVPVTVVGHPLADELPLQCETEFAREALGIGKQERLLAVMPGSRRGEIENIAPEFVRTIIRLHKEMDDLVFWMPSVNERRADQLKKEVRQLTRKYFGLRRVALPIRFSTGNAREVMAASDAVLLASGTATLEAMLLKKPMVAAYKWGTLTHLIISKMVKSPYVTLPNLLADRELVPELIQSDCTQEKLLAAVRESLHPDTRKRLLPIFQELHLALKKNASEVAADAVLGLI